MMQRPWSDRARGTWRALLASALLAALAAPAVRAQQPPAMRYDSSMFRGLEWRNVGPDRGGRSTAVAGSAARPNEYYFGATGGGVWKTTDGGTTWKPVSDKYFHSSSVGSLAVCEQNPDVVYAGMGETELRGNIMQGDGVYKTTDGGKTWKHMGLENSQAIGIIRVLPGGCDDVYAAVFGHPYGKSDVRGIYHSTDGGSTWTKSLYRNDQTGAIDLAVDPADPHTLYAALWDAQRTPWSLSSGGPGSGIFKTTDGGAQWTEITRNHGLPQGVIGKIGLAVSPVDHDRVWALIEARDGGLFRSDDAGKTWQKVNDEQKIRQRAFYYSRIYADPKDKDRVYALNVGMSRSDDAGKTFKKNIRPPHGDNHKLWIAPNDPDRMIESNDGGATVSLNGGDTWTAEDYPTAQLYHVILDNHQPYRVCGAQQDNSTICVPGKDWRFKEAAAPYMYSVGGGESGYIANLPNDPDIYLAGSYGGDLSVFNYANGQERAVNPWPDNPMGYSSKDIAERFQWTFPIIVDPRHPNTIYASSQHVWKTTDLGQSWQKISPDLTRHEPKTMQASGGPITLDQSGVETYATVFTLAPSKLEDGLIWSGSDDGLVYLTRDAGKSWSNVTPPDLPEFSRISLIEASPHQAGTAFVAANRYQLDDLGVYIYRTDDYGRTWTKITDGIAAGDFARVVREDLKQPGLLYAGTEHGFYVSRDDGAHWQSLSLDLPDTQVPDIALTDNDIVIATHGRSFYILDGGASMLRQMTPAVAAADVHLFDPVDPVRGVDGDASFYYKLEKPAQQLSLDVLDARGQVIRSFQTTADHKEPKREAGGGGFFRRGQSAFPPDKAGLNHFTWDLRYPAPDTFPGMIMWAARAAGPTAPPGGYQVRLVADGKTQTQPFTITLDPRVKGVTAADLQAQFDLAMKIRDKTDQANDAVLLIRGIKQQIDDRLEKTKDAGLTRQARAFEDQLGAIEQEIYQVRSHASEDPLNFPIKLNNRIAALQGVVESADTRPTAQSYTIFQALSASLDTQLAALDRTIGAGLPKLNAALQAKGLAPVEKKPLDMSKSDKVAEEAN